MGNKESIDKKLLLLLEADAGGGDPEEAKNSEIPLITDPSVSKPANLDCIVS